MPVNVLMPQIDQFMTQGTIVEWLIKDGEKVKKADPIALVETQKVMVEVEAPITGIFYKAQSVESTVKVGELIALIVQLGEDIPIKQKMKKPLINAEKIAVRVSPLAKRLAKEAEIDLSKISGTGLEGMITKGDILSYKQRVKVIEADFSSSKLDVEQVIPLVGWRKTMAERMAFSMRTTAHVTTFVEVDVTDLQNLRKKLGNSENLTKHKISYTSFFVKAVVQALNMYPIINSSLIDDKIIVKKYFNIGVAVSRKNGLVVVVIHNADQKSLIEISKNIKNKVDRARSAELLPQDVSGGTFTITNVGMFGTIMNTPIINPPESAILGVGTIQKKPVVINDQIVIRAMMFLCLTYDHRIIDGTPAIRFLQEVRQLLENPSLLLN
ncbi:2-oxo acid dehydrogenase subunit E2 [Candidatus Bathyarchaeota archaeon]|nr:MAG: 2-oxo acid dehydrogenase subunit E2 [Candidatus Bathyarchaeota archaeon]